MRSTSSRFTQADYERARRRLGANVAMSTPENGGVRGDRPGPLMRGDESSGADDGEGMKIAARNAERLGRVTVKNRRVIREKFDTLRACLRCAGLRGGQENELVDETKTVHSLVSKYMDTVDKFLSSQLKQLSAAAAAAEEMKANAEASALERERAALERQERAHKALRSIAAKRKAEKQRLVQQQTDELKEYRDAENALQKELESTRRRLQEATAQSKKLAAALKAASTATSEKVEEDAKEAANARDEVQSVESEWKSKLSAMEKRYEKETRVVKKLYREIKHEKEKFRNLHDVVEKKIDACAKDLEAAHLRREQRLIDDHRWAISKWS